MKKVFLIALVVATASIAAHAQSAFAPAPLSSNWTIGVDGGITTPMKNAAFFGSMRGAMGLHIEKQITPTFGLGAEGNWAINTSSWPGQIHSSTAFDSQYIGAYGTVDLYNLFNGYPCEIRPFGVQLIAGAGWGHLYRNEGAGPDWNFFATKLGLSFNFNVSQTVTISVRPSVVWNMSDAPIEQSSAGYDINRAAFNLMGSVGVRLGGDGFDCVTPYDAAQVNALNDKVNALRSDLAQTKAESEANAARAAALATELAACQNTKPTVVTQTNTNLQSVRFVFFKLASSVITSDQMPNVEMIAQYMKNHPDSKVVVKGYASQDGNLEYNIKLAKNRAEAVKDALVKKYGVSASRITADGEGIGHMFKEESWNRVSICTLDE